MSPNLVIDAFDFAEMEKYLLTPLSRQASRQEEMIKGVTVWDKGFGGGTIACGTVQHDKILKVICLWERSRSKNGKHWE